MVIDFHVHMFPDAMAQKTIDTLADKAKLTAYSDGTVSMTYEKMQKAGVTLAVHQNIATNPRQMKKVNDFAIYTNQHEAFVSFGSVHPDAPDYEEELDRLCAAGIRGIKLHPDYQQFFIDDVRMQPIYEAALRRGLIILFHAGLDYGLPEPVHATPEAISHTLGLFCGEKVVFAHMAGFSMNEEAMEHVIGRDVYIDTSCMTDFAEPEMFKAMLEAHRPDKILFATDFPWNDFEREVRAMENMPLAPDLKEKILCKNAESLLGL